MRLSNEQKKIICDTVELFDPTARTFLFGSRTRDREKGGDIDLLCVSKRIDRVDRRKIIRSILDQIGEQRLDFIVQESEDLPFASCLFEGGDVIELEV